MAHFIARQPIFNRSRNVVAYELLFRDGARNAFPASVAAHDATSRVVHDSLNVFGFHDLVGEARAYINVDRATLLSGMLDVLPARRTTIELLETVSPDADVVHACQDLKAKGYELALDDFVFAPGYEVLVHLADVIKIDFKLTVGDERQRVIARHGRRNLRFLAEKIEATEELREAAAVGYTLFQGYFFAKPEMISAQEIRPSKIGRLRLLQLATAAALCFSSVEQAIREDAAISMRLLRYLNSAALGVRAKVTSIKHALTLLGERPLRRWIALVTMAALGEDQPPELLQTSLLHARFCEALGERWATPTADGELFLLGMLSLADAMMGRPMAEVLNALSVTDRVRAALLGTGELAGVLKLATAFARGEWHEASIEARRLGIADADVADAYEDAVTWARRVNPSSP